MKLQPAGRTTAHLSMFLQSKIAKVLLLLAALLIVPPATIAAEQLALISTNTVLTGAEARQHLVLEKIRDGQFVGQITNEVDFISSNPAVVRIEKGDAVPVQ